jgi:N-acetylmuramoyl-L-alanine amidase
MKLLSLCLASLLIYFLLLPAAAEAAVKPVQLYLNGKQLTADVAPQIVKDSTLVPVRIIAEELGAEVKWDGAKRKVTVVKDKTSIVLTIDQPSAVVNDKEVTIEAPPVIIEDTTMLPVRFVSEQLDVKVTWDDLTRSVFLFGKLPIAASGSAGDVKPAPNGIAPSVTPPAPGTAAPPASGTTTPPAGTTTASTPGTQAPGTTTSPAGAATPPAGTATTAASGTTTSPTGTATSTAGTTTPPAAVSGSTGQPGQAPVSQPTGQTGMPPSQTAQQPGSVQQQPSLPSATAPGQLSPQGNQTGTGTGTSVSASDKPAVPTQGTAIQGGQAKVVSVITGIKVEANQVVVSTTGGEASPNLIHVEDMKQVVIDFPYSELAPSFKLSKTNQGELVFTHPTIQKIQYSLFSTEPSIVRIIIDLPNQVDIRRAVTQTAGKQSFDIKSLKRKVIVDAGHGDKDTGAISITGKYEKQFTLSTALKVFKLLEQDSNIEVIMTRKDDTFLELEERSGLANNEKADLFVSIHGNYVDKASVGGIETFYYKKDSLPFATLLHKKVMPVTGFKDRGVKYGNLHVVRETEMQSALIEVGFLSNKDEEALMYQDEFQNKVAAAIAAAIKETLSQP